MTSIIVAIVLLIIGSLIASAKIINQGYQVLVERLGKYQRTLKPGLNFIVPFLDTIVWEETTREQVLDIDPQEAITKDNISVKVDAVIYWKVMDLKKAYYEIQDVENAIRNLVLTMVRSEIGQMDLEKTFSTRKEINQALLMELDEATEGWGVKVTRVEIQEIKPPKTVLESMEKQRAAEIKKRADKLEAEGTAEYMERISETLKSHPNSEEILQYLLAQKYVDANLKLGSSPNSKILFMDPKAMTDALAQLMSSRRNSDDEEENNSTNPPSA